MRAAPVARGPASSRGRYALLASVRTKAGKGKFTRAATSGTAGPDIYEEAALYLADTLAVLRQWDDEALAADFDGDCSAHHTYPSLDR